MDWIPESLVQQSWFPEIGRDARQAITKGVGEGSLHYLSRPRPFAFPSMRAAHGNLGNAGFSLQAFLPAGLSGYINGIGSACSRTTQKNWGNDTAMGTAVSCVGEWPGWAAVCTSCSADPIPIAYTVESKQKVYICTFSMTVLPTFCFLRGGYRQNGSTTFAPRSFAPRSFAPRSFAPRPFAPWPFAPHAFCPPAFCPPVFCPPCLLPPMPFAPPWNIWTWIEIEYFRQSEGCWYMSIMYSSWN